MFLIISWMRRIEIDLYDLQVQSDNDKISLSKSTANLDYFFS